MRSEGIILCRLYELKCGECKPVHLTCLNCLGSYWNLALNKTHVVFKLFVLEQKALFSISGRYLHIPLKLLHGICI